MHWPSNSVHAGVLSCIIPSSFFWASVANAPNLLQPYWLVVLPLNVPDLTASLLLWGPSGQRWRCLWTFLFSNVPTFATSRHQEILAVRGGTTWARNGRCILPGSARLPRNIQGSFTCRKSTTWGRQLCFPSEGRSAEDFPPWKIRRLPYETYYRPSTWGAVALHNLFLYLDTLPPRPTYFLLAQVSFDPNLSLNKYTSSLVKNILLVHTNYQDGTEGIRTSMHKIQAPGITKKKEYNKQNKMKVWNQELVMYVRLSAWNNNSAPTGRIFMKFEIWIFF